MKILKISESYFYMHLKMSVKLMRRSRMTLPELLILFEDQSCCLPALKSMI